MDDLAVGPDYPTETRRFGDPETDLRRGPAVGLGIPRPLPLFVLAGESAEVGCPLDVDQPVLAD